MLLNCGVGEDSWESLGLRSNKSILKEISSEYSSERLMLKLKLQYFGHLDEKSWLIWKDPDAGKDWRRGEKGTTEDEMVGWHHQLNGHEFQQAPGVGDGQGKPGVLQSTGSQRVRPNLVTKQQGKKRGRKKRVARKVIFPVYWVFFFVFKAKSLKP